MYLKIHGFGCNSGNEGLCASWQQDCIATFPNSMWLNSVLSSRSFSPLCVLVGYMWISMDEQWYRSKYTVWSPNCFGWNTMLKGVSALSSSRRESFQRQSSNALIKILHEYREVIIERTIWSPVYNSSGWQTDGIDDFCRQFSIISAFFWGEEGFLCGRSECWLDASWCWDSSHETLSSTALHHHNGIQRSIEHGKLHTI